MSAMNRRVILSGLAATGASLAVACGRSSRDDAAVTERRDPTVLRALPLGEPPWPTIDPFLFCVHHNDAYPAGNERLGPATSLLGRRLGMDFSGLDGWSMYHGDVVPGFPQHPHRGFETVTVVRRGLLDHSDSLGATARYGHGDVQWLTTGSGILHAEMFPLLSEEQPNPVELFQLWLNLPSVDKFAEPHFSMFWSDSVPKVEQTDEQGRRARVTIIAGAWGHIKAPAPPPRSWAAHADSDVAIWTLQLDSGASFILPAAQKGSRRMLYVFRGDGVDIDGGNYAGGQALELRGDHETSVLASSSDLELLLLQGRPIGEPVVKRGPFVMNSEQEIEQAYADFRRTRFGGWPWRRPDPVHEKEGRFAKHADGRLERPV